jgi:hypothetical protein
MDMRRGPGVDRDMMMSDNRMACRGDPEVSRSNSFVERLKLQRWLEGGASISVHGDHSPSLDYMQWCRIVSRNARFQAKRKSTSGSGDALASPCRYVGVVIAKRVPLLRQSVGFLDRTSRAIQASREASIEEP